MTKPLERRTVLAAMALKEMLDDEAADCVHVGSWNVLDDFKLRFQSDKVAAAIFEADVLEELSEDDYAEAAAERERIRHINRPSFAGYKT
jgi:hypothetical protein